MQSQRHIALVVSDQFSLFGFAVTAELFRYANAELGREEYKATAISTSPGLITCSNGTEINVKHGLADMDSPTLIVLCSSTEPGEHGVPPKLAHWLRGYHRQGTSICALGSAVWTIAMTGLLNGKVCAAHWSEISALRRAHPQIAFTRQTFTSANRIWACSGGDSVTDMLLHYLGQLHGPEFAAKLRRKLILKPNLALGDPRDAMFQSSSSDMELISERFLALVEDANETRLTIAEICERLNVSHRTLNRYCHALFGQSPKEVYVNARLRQAKMLLSGTRLPIGDIAHSCGFSTSGSFTQSFRDRNGCTPSTYRKERTSGR